MTSHLNTKSDADYLDLRLLLQSLREKKWLIGTFGVTIFIFAMLYTVFKPTQYQATILLQVQQKQPNTLGTMTKSNQSFDPANIPDEPISVQIALIRSKFILEPVIQSLGLDIHVSPYGYSFFSRKTSADINVGELTIPSRYLKKKLQLTVASAGHYHVYNSQNELLIQGIVGQRLSNHDFSIKVDKIEAPVGSQFALIKDPESEVMTKLLTNLTITDLSGSAETNSNKIGILQLSLIGEDPNLITAILNKIAVVTQQKSIERTSLKAEKTLAFLNQQRPIVQKSLEEAEAKLNHYRATSGKIDIKLQTHYLMTHLADIDKQIQEMQLKKLNMLQQFTVYHPFIVSLTQKMQESEKQRDELLNQLKKLPAADQVAISLTREVNVRNNLYMSLLNQIHELQVIKAGIVSDIHILVLATKPDMPLPVRMTVVGIASLLIGLVVGSIFVLSWRIFVRHIDDPHWIEKVWNIKMLASVPYSKKQHGQTKQFKSNIIKNLPLLSSKWPNDITIESLCHIRTYLQLHLNHTQNAIITVMGLTKGVGKTFISVNLASLVARMGHPVLLIDGDIRSGHMHHYFGASTLGLTDLINAETTLETAIIQSREFKHLHFLPAGKRSENSSDLFTHNRLKSILSEASEKYQYIIMNTSSHPLAADSILIGALANMNLLVLGDKMHEAFEIDRLIKTLNHADIKIHGAIFNHLKPQQYKKNYYWHRPLVTES